MSDPEASASLTETLRSCYDTGLVVLYSLPAAIESIVLRVVTPEGDEPQDDGKYIVEFRHAETGELLEVLEEDENKSFDSESIRCVMDELAETYLRSVAGNWEAYIAQSGRCAPGETGGAAEGGEIERTVIREITS